MTPEDYGVSSETKASEDSLLVGNHPPIQLPLTLLSGQNLVRGTVVGRIDKGAGTIGSGTNTGGGTCTGTITLGTYAKAGIYKLKCVSTASNSGTFIVTSPTGERLPDAVVGTAYTSDHINGFTINDVGTDFAVGDTFTVTVAAGSGKYKAFNSANTDGSEVARAILAHDCNAAAGDKLASAFVHGEFNSAALTGYTAAAGLKLQEFGIFVKGAN